jgi:hypothetical protein
MIWQFFVLVGCSYGAYCIYYGIRFGLMDNYWRGTIYTGQAAVRQGWLCINLGLRLSAYPPVGSDAIWYLVVPSTFPLSNSGSVVPHQIVDMRTWRMH